MIPDYSLSTYNYCGNCTCPTGECRNYSYTWGNEPYQSMRSSAELKAELCDEEELAQLVAQHWNQQWWRWDPPLQQAVPKALVLIPSTDAPRAQGAASILVAGRPPPLDASPS
jgi:hypothetical protein